MPRTEPLTITLDDMAERVEALREAGHYDSTSDVLRAGVRALEREQDALDAYMREQVRLSIEDPRPSVSAEDVLAHMKAFHEARVKAAKRGA